MDITIKNVRRLRGILKVPGDKSISHRALLLGALAEGCTEIHGLSPCEDVQSTSRCLRALGAHITTSNSNARVQGNGLEGLKKPTQTLDAGNSGTTMRLLSGILAGQDFASTITGDDSLRKRPMKRIIEPLRRMGAQIIGTEDEFAPLTIHGGQLRSMTHRLPIASAQVKSCILLAGMYAQGKTTVIEPAKSRDHSERLLSYLGATITIKDLSIAIEGFPRLKAAPLSIPGDISSAAFFMVAASILKNSQVTLKSIGVNLARTGIFDVLSRMGGSVSFDKQRTLNNEQRADIHVQSALLKGIEISDELIPRIIDEIPVLAVAATQAQGQTIIRDAAELRVKETDRIKVVVENLRKMGARVLERPDGMVIEGATTLKGAEIECHGDHRIAMAFAVAGLLAQGETLIQDAECADISYPGFFQQLEALYDD